MGWASMSEELLINSTSFETRVALVVAGALQELHISRASGYTVTGNIYLGKVVRIIPGMQAAFVDIGLERPGFLHVGDVVTPGLMTSNSGGAAQDKPNIRDLLHDGQQILVQVGRDPLSTKGARLTMRLALAAKYLVLTPLDDHIGISQRIEDKEERARLHNLLSGICAPHGVGVIARTLSEGGSEAQLADDFTHLLGLWQHLSQKLQSVKAPCEIYLELPIQNRLVRDLAGIETTSIVADNRDTYDQLAAYLKQFAPDFLSKLRMHESEQPIFQRNNVEEEIERALQPQVRLKSGGTLVIEETEAMVSIDVNTAGFLGSREMEETVFQTNREAAQAIPRELRLRNLGGIIVIDFIDMQQPAHRESVLAVLTAALDEDPVKTHVEGFSSLGLVQVSRKRTRQSLVQSMCMVCSCCDGRGKVKTPESTCQEVFRALVAEKLSQSKQNPPKGEYLVTANEAVVDRLLDEEAQQLQLLSAELEISVRIQVEPTFRAGQFDVFFVQAAKL